MACRSPPLNELVDVGKELLGRLPSVVGVTYARRAVLLDYRRAGHVPR